MSTVTVKTAVERYDFEDYGTLEESGRYVRHEDYLALQAERDALAAENAALKAFGDKLDRMHNDLNGEGTGIQGRAEVACQQIALEAALEEFDAIKAPATDAFLGEVRAQGVEMFSEQQRSFIGKPSKNDAASSYCSREAIKFADQLRQGGAV